MDKLLSEIRQTMIDEGYKCIASNGAGFQFHSDKMGIAPLLDLYEQKPGGPLTICDRVFGKAAVYVAHLCGGTTCYAFVASEPAVALAKELGMDLTCERTVPIIMNRDETGQCPIENSVMDATTPEEALHFIRTRLGELRSQK